MALPPLNYAAGEHLYGCPSTRGISAVVHGDEPQVILRHGEPDWWAVVEPANTTMIPQLLIDAEVGAVREFHMGGAVPQRDPGLTPIG